MCAGKKEARPLGFDRISVETSPEVYPAVTDKFADPLPGMSVLCVCVAGWWIGCLLDESEKGVGV